MKSIKDAHKERTKKHILPKSPKAKGKVKKVMEEYKSGALHSGSKKGPVVKNRKQAIAIALAEQRKAAK